MTIALTLQRYLAASVVATLAKTALFWFLIALALICAIWAARAQQSNTAEAERYIKESESQWAESVRGVRFTSQSGHVQRRRRCLLSAISGHMR
jgi:hypothetical protein